jgi:hypothetical protein
VAAPVIGCPAPDFPDAEAKARRVLFEFLDDDQQSDYLRHGSFVSTGVETGHRYMLTSRESRGRLKRYEGRTLYDLDERCSYCVHDWDVPASEELLSLHVLLSLPGWERYVRGIPMHQSEEG